MKKQLTVLLTATLLLTSLTGCTNENSSTSDNSSVADTSNSVTSDSSSSSSESENNTESTSSDEITTSSGYISYEDYISLKGEELISQFEWPYDDKIDLTGAAARSIKGDVVEEIALNDISNEFLWNIQCDYGYLATMPEQGNEYKFQKYKAGDKIGDFTITEIHTRFNNSYYETLKYFAGTKASFEGEVTLTGEISIIKEELAAVDEIKFYPDEESKKKLPVVDFRMKSEGSQYDLMLTLGNKSQYPNIDFSDIPTDGTRVKAEIIIEDYGYRAMYGLPFIGGARIVGDSISICSLTPLSFTDKDLELQKILGDLMGGASAVHDWFTALAFGAEIPQQKIRLINTDGAEENIYWAVPENYKDFGSTITIPSDYDEMKKTVSTYFTNQATAEYMKRYYKGVVVGESNGVLDIKLDKADNMQAPTTFIEAAGQLYRLDAVYTIPINMDCSTARVTSSSDDRIEFTFLEDTYDYQPNTEFKYEEIYPDYARQGYIALEDGKWKLPQWQSHGFVLTQ